MALTFGTAVGVALAVAGNGDGSLAARGQEPARPVLHVPAVEDFAINGRGDHAAWTPVPWTPLAVRGDVEDAPLTRMKVAWSSTGLYVLMEGADRRLTATFEEDFADLWKEDVFEAFVWPDERDPLYFEYEISPLGRELPILIPNLDGQFLGWRPWHYGGGRRVKHAASVDGGPQQPGASITAWRGEFVIPHALLSPLRNVPPAKGTRWRANFYRVDHDGGTPIAWDWARVGKSFHEFRGFGTLLFD
jgi:hypothetical protein